MSAPVPPPPPPPPAYPPVGYPPPGAPARRMSPILLIVGVVAGVLVLGAVFFFVGRAFAGGGDDEPVAAPSEAPGVLTPIPAPTQPSVEPIPSQPAPAPGPATPSPIESQPSSETIPAPPPTTPQAPEPTDDPDSGPNTDAVQIVDIGAGVEVAVPPGWEASQIEGGGVLISRDLASSGLYLLDVPAGTTGGDVINYWVREVVSQRLSDLQLISEITPIPADTSPSVISAATVTYEGVLVTQQGSIPTAGFILAFVRGDGISLVINNFAFEGFDEEEATAAWELINASAYSSF